MIDYSEIAVSTEKTSDDYIIINSCGIEYLTERDRGSMRKKGRVDHHILYIERGICRLTVGENTINVPAGGLIMFRPGEPQIYGFLAEDNSVSHYIHFTGRGCDELLTKLGINDITVFDMGVSRRYEELSADMVREYTMKKPYWEIFCASKLIELLGLIARKYELRTGNVSHVGESRINTACRRIYDRLEDPPTLKELADESCLSVSRFSHLFKEVTGKSVSQFIISMRMEKAKELLSSGELSVKEAAACVGYEDQNYFSRIYKKTFGKSPSKM